LGLIPVNNISAVKYTRAVGMKPAGRVPGIFYDVYDNSTVNGFLSYMTLETCIQTRKRGVINGRKQAEVNDEPIPG
jgi:hypothetical protein